MVLETHGGQVPAHMLWCKICHHVLWTFSWSLFLSLRDGTVGILWRLVSGLCVVVYGMCECFINKFYF